MESVRIRRGLLALLLASGMALTTRVPAVFSQGGPTVRPRTSLVEVVAIGYKGWLTDFVRVESGAYVIRLQSEEGQPPFKDYVQLSGNERQSTATFHEVPVPAPGERPYSYKVAITFEGHFWRKRDEHHADHHDEHHDEEERVRDQEFDVYRDARLSSQDAGHMMTLHVQISSFDIPVP